MTSTRLVTFASVTLLTGWSQAAFTLNAAAPPAAENLRSAQPALGYDPAKRCPELRQSVAEEGAIAVVKFVVGPTGVPSQASVRSSSGSSGFDAAAVSCVLKLRFSPATRYGDAAPVESWQQLALKWTGTASAPQTARCEGAGDASGGAAGGSVLVAQAPEGGSTSRDAPGPTMARAGVCVCVDESGKIAQAPVLTSSSGIAGVDKAALELSSAAHYRPAASAGGQPTPGCFRFKVGIEMK